MLEIQFKQFGPPSRVASCVRTSFDAEPSAWDAIVQIDAFPINPADLAQLAGQYGSLPKLPATIGMEAAGRVIEIGDSVENVAVGDRVMIMANGNWAQRRKLPATTLHKVPNDLDPLQVAMMKVNPATALLMLTREVQLKPGAWVIQNAPLSNVGRCVIQLAKAKGYKTINVVRRPEAIDEVKVLGGDVAVMQSDDLAAEVSGVIRRGKLMLALDAVGGPETGSLASCLSYGGKVINYGMLSGEACQLRPEHTIFGGVSLIGFWLSKIINRMTQDERTMLYDEIADLIANGRIQGRVDQCFDIEQINEAIERAEQFTRNGKVIVLPNGPISSGIVDASSQECRS